MKTITLMNHKLHLYWKKMATLGVVGSLLFGLVFPPIASAYSIDVEIKTVEEQRSKPEDFKLRKVLQSMNPDEGKEEVAQLASQYVNPKNLPLIMKEYRTRYEAAKNSAAMEEVAQGGSTPIGHTSFTGAMNIFNRILSKGNITASRRSNVLLRASKLISVDSLKKTAKHLSAFHVGALFELVKMIHENHQAYPILDQIMSKSFNELFLKTERFFNRSGNHNEIPDVDEYIAWLISYYGEKEISLEFTEFLRLYLKEYLDAFEIPEDKWDSIMVLEEGNARNVLADVQREIKYQINHTYKFLGIEEIKTRVYDDRYLARDQNLFILAFFTDNGEWNADEPSMFGFGFKGELALGNRLVIGLAKLSPKERRERVRDLVARELMARTLSQHDLSVSAMSYIRRLKNPFISHFENVHWVIDNYPHPVSLAAISEVLANFPQYCVNRAKKLSSLSRKAMLKVVESFRHQAKLFEFARTFLPLPLDSYLPLAAVGSNKNRIDVFMSKYPKFVYHFGEDFVKDKISDLHALELIASTSSNEIFEIWMPKLANEFNPTERPSKFVREHLRDLIMMIRNTNGKPRYPLVSLVQLNESYGSAWIEENWNDLMILLIGTPQSDLKNDLVELKESFGEKWVDNHWGYLIRFAKSYNSMLGNKFVDGLSKIKKHNGGWWIDNHWSDLMELRELVRDEDKLYELLVNEILIRPSSVERILNQYRPRRQIKNISIWRIWLFGSWFWGFDFMPDNWVPVMRNWETRLSLKKFVKDFGVRWVKENWSRIEHLGWVHYEQFERTGYHEIYSASSDTYYLDTYYDFIEADIFVNFKNLFGVKWVDDNWDDIVGYIKYYRSIDMLSVSSRLLYLRKVDNFALDKIEELWNKIKELPVSAAMGWVLASIKDFTDRQISALHAGTDWDLVQMFHRLNDIHNLPKSFWYSFNKARNAEYKKPEQLYYDSEWWFVKQVITGNNWRIGRDLIADRVDMYAEKYKVDEKEDRTVDEIVIPHLDEDEITLRNEFHALFLEMFNTTYHRLLLKNVDINFLEGPGMIYGEDDFILAFFKTEDMFRAEKRDKYGDVLSVYDTRRPQSTFYLDRRFARAIINLGKEKGLQERRKIIEALVEREMIVQSYMDSLNKEGKIGNRFNQSHEVVLEFPGQKELLEYATRVALEIRFGNVPDYKLVKEMIETMFSAEAQSGDMGSVTYPDDLPNTFIEYLNMLFEGGVKGAEGHAKALHDIFTLMKKDYDLYLEYKAVVEKILLLTRASFKVGNTAMFLLFPINVPIPKVNETLAVVKGAFEEFRLKMGNWHYYKTLALEALRVKYEELKSKKTAQRVVGLLVIGVSAAFIGQLPAGAVGFSGEVLSAKSLIDIAPFLTGALGLAMIYPTSTDAAYTASSIKSEPVNGDTLSKSTALVLDEPLPNELTSIYHAVSDNIDVFNIRLLPNIKDIPSLAHDLIKFIDDAERDADKSKIHEIRVVSDYKQIKNESQVLDYLAELGIRPTSHVRIRAIHHPLELDGTFNLKTLIEANKDKLFSDGYSLRVLNRNNFWSYVEQVMRNVLVVNKIDLIELYMAGEKATEESQ